MESGPKAAPHEQSPCAFLGRLVKTYLEHGAEHPKASSHSIASLVLEAVALAGPEFPAM